MWSLHGGDYGDEREQRGSEEQEPFAPPSVARSEWSLRLSGTIRPVGRPECGERRGWPALDIILGVIVGRLPHR